MDFDSVCRTCLGEKSLKPIFKNREHHERFSMAMWNTTGLRVELDDGLPQNICIDCMVLVNKSLKFRAMCKDVEMKLLKMRTDYDESTESALSDCDNIKDNITTEILNEEAYDSSDEEKPMLNTFEESYTETYTQPLVKTVAKTGIKRIKIIENTLIKNVHEEQDDYEDDYNTNQEYLTEIGSEVVCEINSNVDRDIDSITCDICLKSLTLNSFITHLKFEHRGVPSKKIKCNLCDGYIEGLKLNWHTVTVHGRNSSICKFCKLDHYSMESLSKHQKFCEFRRRPARSTYGDNNKMGECDVCHKKMQKTSIKMHQKIKHAGLGPVCDHCGKKFGNKFRLNEHLRSKHGYEKFKCSQEKCSFETASKSTLTNHIRRHRGEKPYVCEACGASFHASYLLTQHAQSHRTERLLKCNLCPASFKANNTLHMHKISCHSTSKFKCWLCPRLYSCRHYAVKHARTVHRHSGPVPPLERHVATSVERHAETTVERRVETTLTETTEMSSLQP